MLCESILPIEFSHKFLRFIEFQSIKHTNLSPFCVSFVEHADLESLKTGMSIEITYCLMKKYVLLAAVKSSVKKGNPWRDGRVVEGARLESVYTPKGYRGFESRSLRKKISFAF